MFKPISTQRYFAPYVPHIKKSRIMSTKPIAKRKLVHYLPMLSSPLTSVYTSKMESEDKNKQGDPEWRIARSFEFY